MAIDYELTTELGTRLSKRGDIQAVSDAEEIRQEIVIAIVENADLTTPPLTESALEIQRSSIEQAVRNSDRTLEPITVSVSTIDRENETVTYDVVTRRVSVPLSTS